MATRSMDATPCDESTGTTHGARRDPVARLGPLLAAAAELHLEDGEGWSRFRRTARATTAALVADGTLPAHLAVDADDPPVVIARTIAAAWRHATDAPTRRPDRVS